MYETRLVAKVMKFYFLQYDTNGSVVTLIPDNLYKTFLQVLFDKLPKPAQSTVNLSIVKTESTQQKPAAYPAEQIAKFRKEFTKNPFLFLFENQLSQMEKSGEPTNRYIFYSLVPNGDDLFERLRPATSFILPYHQYFVTILTNLLKARISVANNYVLEIYKNEHQLVHHLQNLPKIYFMEAGDLMSDFYSKLFTQVSVAEVISFGHRFTKKKTKIFFYFRLKMVVRGTIHSF